MQMNPIDPIEGPCAWHGRDIARSNRWKRELTSAHTEELDVALDRIEKKGMAWYEITAADFPLPRMAELFAEMRAELEGGSGLMKLSGFPVDRYTENQLRQIYFGFGVNFALPIYQNRSGELMRLIRDERIDTGKKYGQINDALDEDGKPFLSSYARTLNNGPLRFHTDRTDVVSLLCVRQAAEGGVSTICSSVAVMNEMLRRRPDLARALFEPLYRSRLGEEAETADVVYALPVFGVRDGKFTSHFSRTFVEAAQKAEGVPRLTDKQNEAMDMLLELAAELAFEMRLAPGDIQFLNSHVTYHGRTPFEDDVESGEDRLLMRIWYSMPNSRPLPEDHKVLWGDIEAGQKRGGIGQILMA